MNDWLKSLISAIFLFVMLVLAYQLTQAPAVRTDTGLDYAALSAHVARIAAKPHPIGSAANREVRDYIVQYFEGLGLQTEVQKTTVVFRHPFRSQSPTIIGNVENIIARLPGTGEGIGDGEDLVLMAHYDSRADGPGAGDDASGTAAIMEAARILVTEPAPRRDIVFLITDGEEAGLLGAQGFFRQHPAAKKVGLVLNFEARGSYGVSTMFETTDGNAWLIDNLLQSAPDLMASSLTDEIYKRMPNDTDMSITRGEGIPGLNFAFIAGLHDYHSMGDTAANLDFNTLAQQANYVLATARYFANMDTWQNASSQESAGNKTYFNVWRSVLVSYSQSTALLIGITVLLFGLWRLARALRSGQVSWGGLSLGLLVLVVLLVLVSNIFAILINYQRGTDAGIARLVAQGEWPFFAYLTVTLGLVVWMTGAVRRGMSKAEAVVPLLAFAALSLLAGGSWLSTLLLLTLIPLLLWLRSRQTRPSLWSAALLAWWLLTALTLYAAPTASYVFVWPLGAVLLGITLQHRLAGPAAGTWGTVLNMLVAIVVLILLAPVLILGYLALGTTFPQGVMVLSTLVLLLIWPLMRDIARPANGVPAWLLLGAGLIMTAVVMFGRDFDTRHQRGEELFYAIDGDQQQGFWVTPDARPGSWLSDFMGSEAQKANVSRILPGYDRAVDIRETDVPAFQAATLEVTSDRLLDGQREVGLHLQSPTQAQYINLLFSREVLISAASVNGFPLALPTDQQEDSMTVEKAAALKASNKESRPAWWRWRWYGLPAEGADIVLRMEPGKSLPVRIVEVDWGTPAGAPRRPEESMPPPYRWSDSTVIFQTMVLK